MPDPLRPQLKRSLLLFIGVAIAYAVGSRMAFSWFGAGGVSASFFPSAGVTLAALVLTRRREWPIVLAAAGTAEFLIDLYHEIDLVPTLGYVAANLTEPLVGALLLTTLVARVDLSRTRDLGLFVLCAVIAGPAVGGVIGATTIVFLDDGDDWLTYAAQWWVGDGLGVLVVAGSVLALQSEPVRALGGWRVVEGLALAALALGATVLVFWFDWFPLVYLPIALLLVIAFRIGTAGVALTGAGIAFLAAEASAEGHTFWDTVDVAPSTGVVYLQFALGILISPSLALAAEIAQRERAASAWAAADVARRESASVAVHAERLRALAESIAQATTRDEVAAALTRHGFPDVVGLPPVGSIADGPQRYVRESAGRIARDAYARVELLEGERQARRRAELLEQHASRLAAAATDLEVADATVAMVEEAGIALVGVERVRGGMVEVLRVSGVSADVAARFTSYPVELDTPGAAAMRTGAVFEARSPEEYDARLPGTADERARHGVEAVLGIPLRDSLGGVTGAVTLALTDATLLDDELRQLVGGIAELTGVALERASAFVAEKAARERAEELERRAARLQQVTAALAAARTTEEFGGAVVSELIPAVGGMGGSVFVFDDENDVLRMIDDDGFPAGLLDSFRVVPVSAEAPLAEAFRLGRPLLFRNLTELHSRYPELVDGLRLDSPEHGAAFADFPLVAGSRKVGHLAIAYSEPRDFDSRERAYLFAATDAAAQALARIMLDEAERDARWRAELLERHAKHLAASTTPQEVVDATIDVLAPVHSATVCLVDGETVRIASSSGLSEKTRMEFAEFPVTAKVLAAAVIRSGSAVEVQSGEEYDERFPEGAGARRLNGSESLRSVPLLTSDGRPLGALTLSSPERGWFTDSLRQLLDGMSEQTALALERAKLHERAQRAAEDAAFLVRLGDVLERAASADARARALVELLEVELGTRCCLRVVDEEDGGWRLLAASPAWSANESVPWEAIPLRARGRTIGALEIRDHSAFSSSELGREIVTRAAIALDNALLYDRERKVSHTLQLGLLGGALAEAEGVEVAAAYRAGTAALDVGGDWYDAFHLPSGALALVVGDVVGHGLDAAIVMGQLRGAVRALAPACEPARLLEHLDVFVETLPDAGMATIAYVELDPETGRMRYACAGHPPPLVVSSLGESRYLWEGRSAAIGSLLGMEREDAVMELGAGETLVLYTDGVIERRNESLDRGLERLALAAVAPLDPGQLVEHIPDVLLEGQTQDDDVCVLAARRAPVEARFVHTFPASPAELAPLRARLRAWLDDAGLEREVVDGVLLGVSEAAANSIEHGLGFDESGRVTVEAHVDGDGRLELTVRDDGRWRAARSDPDRGHGLHIIETLMDGMSVDRLSSGTVVRMARSVKGASRV